MAYRTQSSRWQDFFRPHEHKNEPVALRQKASGSDLLPRVKDRCACGGGCPSCESKLAIQTKLAVSEPGDMYEQEADRVADRVMRMPAPLRHQETGVTKSPGAVVQRKCADCENNEELIQKKGRAGQLSATHQSPDVSRMVHEVVRSPGQALDAETRAFMEPRFGYDFGNVQIHNDPAAHRSSREINALAYTQGDHVVFGAGQYQPQTNAGKELLAHELAHVMQQKKSGNVDRLFRRIDHPLPQFLPPTNAISAFLAGGNLALTTPTVNGIALPDDLMAAGEIIFKAFKLDADSAFIRTVGEEGVCSYDEPVVNISANMALVQRPNGNKWSGQTLGSNLAGRNPTCRDRGNIPVEATGRRNATTIYDKMRSNEMEHYNDLKALSAVHLGRLLTLLRSFRDTTARSDEECQTKFQAFIGSKGAEAILAFLQAVAAKVRERDVRPGPHLFIPEINIAQDCSRIDIVVRPST